MRTNGIAPAVIASMVVSTWGKANLCLGCTTFGKLKINQNIKISMRMKILYIYESSI